MKNLSYFLGLILLLVATPSCTDKGTDVGKGQVTSATYDHSTNLFTVNYNNGKSDKVTGTIDDSLTPPYASAVVEDGIIIYVTDASMSGNAVIAKDVNTVSQFIHDGMSNYYLWAEEVRSKRPTVADYNPSKYFYKILNPIDTKNGWSWITNDINSLLSGSEGESTDAFGFQPFALWTDETQTNLIGFIRYVYPETPAEKAGLKRGEVISRINGQIITKNNYLTMFGAKTETTFTVLDKNFSNPREVKVTPAQFNTDPVLYTNVYEIEEHKIGYIFYTNFLTNYNESLYNAFANFKSAGITDLVVDLRYNPGGRVGAAIYLASLIAPAQAVRSKEVFTIMSYNPFLNALFDDEKVDRKQYLGQYNKEQPDPLTANPDLNNVYILTTRSSASASELVTFCLDPYMNVVQIGEKTSGKYTASWIIHAYNNYNETVQPVYVESSLSEKEKNTLKNWGMQPIVGQYTDKNNKDFISTNGLIPTHEIQTQEYNTGTWEPIGNVNDYLFAKAISLITGMPYTSSTRASKVTPFKEAALYAPIEEIFLNGVIIESPGITPLEKK